MPANNKHVSIETKFSNEMYNCIEEQHGSTESTVRSPSSFSMPQHLQQSNTTGNGILHMPQQQSQSPLHSSNGQQTPNNNGTTGKNHTMQGFEIDQQRSSSYDDAEYYQDNPNGNSHHHHNHRRHTKSHHDHHHDDRPSNTNLLGTAFCSFMSFALVQSVVAMWAKSEAMLGDSAAMIVDALTYLFNWYAERKKTEFETEEWIQQAMQSYDDNDKDAEDVETRQRILERTRRKNILQLELIPPLISVSTLLVVTAVVLRHSIKVLVLDAHRAISLQGNPNIHIMMYFSIANLGLDLVNVANFAKAKHLFGYETNEYQPPQGHEALADHSDGDQHHHHGDNSNGLDLHGNRNNNSSNVYNPSKEPPSPKSSMDDDDDDDEEEDHHANLNMCSAYTHVFADTLRSIAVLVAASLSELVEEVTPEEADAAAAVVVSALIVLSLIPLVNGLVQSSRELRLIRAEEKSDEMLFAS